MVGAKNKMLEYMLKHVGEFIPISRLRIVSGNISDWARVLRTLRQEGWAIEAVKHPSQGYILKSDKKGSGNIREGINDKIRYQVLARDKSTCQRCGRTPKDGVKLHIDHILPVEWGGTGDISNLQILCAQCNQGKKDFVASQDARLMKKISSAKSAYAKLKIFFKENPRKDIPFDILETISNIRDWERTVRYVRSKEKMKIKAFKKGRIWYYRYVP